METEAEATNRAIQLARVAGCPLYVVHVSCKDSIEPIALAREKGWEVWGETCTQYLFIDETALDQPGFEGAKYIYTPPPRPKEHQEHLWKALRVGRPLGRLDRPLPVQLAGAEGDQRRGVPDDPERRPRASRTACTCCTTSACAKGRISMNRFVELTSTNVAKLFGLYPRKGTIAPGSDADIVVWDPEKRLTISAATHHSNVNYNLFEGTEVQGAPEVVLVRGQVIVEGDELVGKPGDGQFVKRARFGEELDADRRRWRCRMSDEQAREVYAKAGLGESVTLGSRPAVLVVDFSCGFTDPECALGSDLTAEVEATKRLLDAARAKGLPVDLHDDRLRAEPQGRRASGCRRCRRSASCSSAAAGSRSTRASSRARTRRSS